MWTLAAYTFDRIFLAPDVITVDSRNYEQMHMYNSTYSWVQRYTILKDTNKLKHTLKRASSVWKVAESILQMMSQVATACVSLDCWL